MIAKRSDEITEQEMHVARKEIQREETYNTYGVAERRIQIEALEDHGAFVRVRKKWNSRRGRNNRRKIRLYH